MVLRVGLDEVAERQAADAEATEHGAIVLRVGGEQVAMLGCRRARAPVAAPSVVRMGSAGASSNCLFAMDVSA
jgi:hypothetical protein